MIGEALGRDDELGGGAAGGLRKGKTASAIARGAGMAMPPPTVANRRVRGRRRRVLAASTIEVAVGYHKANTSPILKAFLSRIDALVAAQSERGGG